MATEFTRLEAILTANTRQFDTALTGSDAKVVAFGAKTKAALSDVAKDFQTKFGYLPTIARREFANTTQATTKAVNDIARSLTPLERHVSSAAKRLADLDVSRSLSRGTSALVAESVAAIAKLDSQVLRLRNNHDALGKSFDSAHTKATGFGAGLSRVGAVASVVAATVGAIGLGIFQLASRSAAATMEISTLSRQLGVTVETLSAMKLAGQAGKVSIDQIGTALANFEKFIGTADQGSKNHVKTLGSLKIATKDTETAIRSAFTQLSKMPDGYEKTTAAMQLFGDGGKAMLSIIKETNGDIDQAIKKYGDLGRLISTEDVKAAREFTTALKGLEAAMDDLGRQIVTGLAPNLGLITAELSLILSLVGSIISLAARALPALLGLVGLGALQGRVAAVQTVFDVTQSVLPNQGGGPHLPKLGGRGGGGGESAAKRAARQALEMVQVDLQTAERVSRQLLDAEKRRYEEGLNSLQQYTERRIEIENKRYQAEMDTFGKERELINQSVLDAGEKALKLRQIEEKEDAAMGRHIQALEEAQHERQRKEREAAYKHLESLLRLRQTFDDREIGQQKDLMEQGVTSRVAYETRLNDILYDAWQTRKDVLFLELQAAGKNEEKYAEVWDKLIQGEEEFVNAYEDGLRRIGKARQEDLESAQKYIESLRNLKFENVVTAMGIGRGRLERDERLGIRGARDTRREMDKLDIEEENERHNQRTIEAIERLNQALLSSDVNTLEKRQAVLDAYYEQALLMATQHEDTLREIRERPLVELREQMIEIAADLADIVSSAFRGGWGSVLDGFLNLLDQLANELLNSAFLAILNQPQTGSKAGGLLGTIANSIIGAIFGGIGGGGTTHFPGWSGGNINAVAGFASGGDLTPWMGQPVQVHKDEMIVPYAPGYVVPKGQSGGNQTTVNHINVTYQQPRGGTFRQNRSKREIAERIASLLAA